MRTSMIYKNTKSAYNVKGSVYTVAIKVCVCSNNIGPFGIAKAFNYHYLVLPVDSIFSIDLNGSVFIEVFFPLG